MGQWVLQSGMVVGRACVHRGARTGALWCVCAGRAHCADRCSHNGRRWAKWWRHLRWCRSRSLPAECTLSTTWAQLQSELCAGVRKCAGDFRGYFCAPLRFYKRCCDDAARASVRRTRHSGIDVQLFCNLGRACVPLATHGGVRHRHGPEGGRTSPFAKCVLGDGCHVVGDGAYKVETFPPSRAVLPVSRRATAAGQCSKMTVHWGAGVSRLADGYTWGMP